MQHHTHPDIVNRLRRVEGHLRTVISMIETGRPCTELAQQLHAVENAVAKAKQELIHDHIDHCLGDAISGDARKTRATLAEFKVLTKYL